MSNFSIQPTDLPPRGAAVFSFRNLTWKHAFWFLAAALFIGMPILSLGFGITWDEWIQSHYGKLVLKFILTGGQDKSALGFGKTMYLYGGLFDTLTAAVYGLLFDSLKNVTNYPLLSDFYSPHWHSTRHVINSLFGATAILFTGLAARKIAGWRAGTFALLLISLSPRFFGNSMNNPKDIPFAAAAAIFIYFAIHLLEELPHPSRKTLAGTALGIALAINVKAGGILFLCYIWLFVGLAWLGAQRIHSQASFSLARLLKILIPVSAAGYFGGILFWPFGWMNPLLHPIQALGAFSKFGDGGILLFDGRLFDNGITPWYYLPKWIFISSPVFFTLALFAFLFTAKILFSKYNRRILSFLIFCALFPLVYAIAKKAIVYDSWRHFLFIYPPMIILSALIFDFLIARAAKLRIQRFAWILFVLLLAEPLSWMIRNHPNEYVYFSPLAGGLKHAHGRYETDYWGNCFRQAAEGFLKDYRATHAPGPVVIKAEAEPICTAPFFLRGLGQYYTIHEPDRNQWQYSFEFTRGKGSQDLINGTWPGPNAVYTVSADQVPLCAVIENR